jgi:hypothetical protein
MDWILKYWMQELFATHHCNPDMVRKEAPNVKKPNTTFCGKEFSHLLHDRLYTACSFFITRGWASLWMTETTLSTSTSPTKRSAGTAREKTYTRQFRSCHINSPDGEKKEE